MIEDITFNGENLNAIVDAKLFFHDFNVLPERDIKKFPLARANRTVVTAAHFISKEITLSFFMQGCDRCSTECALNHLKQLTQCKNGTLGVIQCFGSAIATSGEPFTDMTDCSPQLIEYRDSTLQDLSIEWFGQYARVEATFFIADPFGYGTLPVFLAEGCYTSSPTLIDLFITDGTSNEQEPVIELTVNSATMPSSDPQLSLFSNQRAMTIRRQLAAGDMIVVNSQTGIVTLNGDPINVNGSFPVFKTSENTLTLTDNFQDRDICYNISYVPRYL